VDGPYIHPEVLSSCGIPDTPALALVFAVSAGAWAAPGNFDLTKIKAKFGSWTGDYDSELEYWTFETDDDVSIFFVELADVEEGGRYNDYAANLTKKDWLDQDYVWTKILTKEKLSDGFLFTGLGIDYTDEEAEAVPTFVLVRVFKNTAVICSGDAATAKLLTEVLNYCKGLK
jgi:hypothetical protein